MPVDRVQDLLQRLNQTFIPPLEAVVVVPEYVRKIAANGCVLLAREVVENEDVGLLAFYANRRADGVAYVTSLGVIPEYYGVSVGHKLLAAAKQISRERGFRRMALRVASANGRAVHFYAKHGFTPSAKGEKDGMLEMVADL